jgi:hypothetical protein
MKGGTKLIYNLNSMVKRSKWIIVSAIDFRFLESFDGQVPV